MPRFARYLVPQVRRDLLRKMVFVAGPRQVGKTTLARSLPGAKAGYLSWDVPADRERILRGELPPGRLWAFDEIHKYRTWRRFLKGLYDARPRGQRILVTGSARLDFYRFGGDSLQGRYHLLRLHPLSVAELGVTSPGGLEDLLALGGFPEPFFGGSATESRRWSREDRQRLVSEEVSSLERVQDLGALETLMLRLPELVGSPLSLNALREDLQVSHRTVAGWVAILERLYAVFRLPPFGAPRIRAVKKEQKHYHFDWTLVPGEGPRFENLVASHLLKLCHHLEDSEGHAVALHYLRDRDGREVDFLVTVGRKPWFAVEVKLSETRVDPALAHFRARLAIPWSYQVVLEGTRDFVQEIQKDRRGPPHHFCAFFRASANNGNLPMSGFAKSTRLIGCPADSSKL